MIITFFLDYLIVLTIGIFFPQVVLLLTTFNFNISAIQLLILRINIIVDLA